MGLLVLLWVGGLLALGWWLFTIGMEQWAASYSPGDAGSADLGRRASDAAVFLGLLAAGGPLLIALVASEMRLRRTAIGFLVLAVAVGVPALALGAVAYRDPSPPPPATTVPGCRELSGGDTRCPGG
ncbi:DUF6234 family protein [Micromonospora mirobrigensis]|uniref:DUF6234 family protein n=1 Tax=Micromonospora mirobrigensis TaxID=262898 RepID=UPI000B88CA15|nr:DUF6234 family protein [Micromonospora mirobrigensis]